MTTLTEHETATIIMASVACQCRGAFTVHSLSKGYYGKYYRAFITTQLKDIRALGEKFQTVGGNMIGGGVSLEGTYVDFTVTK